MENGYLDDPMLSQVQRLLPENVIRYPLLPIAPTSLTATEKMLLGNFIQLIAPHTIVELGVLQALTTEFICDFLQLNDLQAKVFGFDIPDIVAQLRVGSRRLQELETAGMLRLVPGFLPASLFTWLKSYDAPLDMVIIDASHSYQNVARELGLLWPRLSPDGMILCHDYHWENDPNIPGDMKGVSYAVDFFATRTPGVHVLSLKSSMAARSRYGWKCQSVLVALRRRPYRLELRRLLLHLMDALIWKFQGYKYGIVKGKK